jgi:hypothetical protein
LDQGAQAFVDECGPLRHAGQALSLSQQVIVEVKRDSHR